MSEPLLESLTSDTYDAAVPDLARLLVDTVASGASVSFLAGLDQVRAEAWWRAQAGHVRGGAVPIVARIDGRIVGSAVLVPASSENGAHRAEVIKVMVEPGRRRSGIGRALMARVEAEALTRGWWLLVLDTEAGSAGERMYRADGWQEAGSVPDYARRPDGLLSTATYYWKDLRDQAAGP